MKRLAALALVAAAFAAAPADDAKPAPKFVIVFDLAGGAPGRQLADSIRVRLRKHKGEYSVIDRLTTADVTPAGGVTLKTPDAKVVALLKDQVGAHIAIFGEVEKLAGGARAEVRCVDISGAGKPVVWTEVFSDDTERARGEIARGVVEKLRSKASWKPPEYGDEDEPKSFGKTLNVSGDFESGAGWQRPDNVSMMFAPDPRAGHKGKVLRLFTDLDREAWLKYQRDLRLGKADPNHPPKIGTVANKYATVAGLEGVHFRSQWIKAKPGQRYWLVADMKGKSAGMFFPKIFVKGFPRTVSRAPAMPAPTQMIPKNAKRSSSPPEVRTSPMPPIRQMA